MNYIKIINRFMATAPHQEGYNSAHCGVFMAVVDAINRNEWREKTKIDLGNILHNSGTSKPTYIKARDWLVENGWVEFTPGKNAYVMAEFSLGMEVNIFTSSFTGSLPQPIIEVNEEVNILSSSFTGSLPINNKQVNNKTINNKGSEKPSKKFNPSNAVLPFNTQAFSDAWKDWIDHLSQKRKTPTEKAVELQIRKLGALSEAEAIATINQSIENNWQGLFELKAENKPTPEKPIRRLVI